MACSWGPSPSTQQVPGSSPGPCGRAAHTFFLHPPSFLLPQIAVSHFPHQPRKSVRVKKWRSNKWPALSSDSLAQLVEHPASTLITGIQGRSQTSYTTLCDGVVNHGAQIGVFQFFANHIRGHKCKQNTSTIFTCHMALHTCLSSRSDGSTYAPNESRLFWSQEKTLDFEFEPHAGIKMAQILRSPLYMCVWWKS